MNIVWKGANPANFESGRRNTAINKIVLHWFGVGTLESANARFQSASQASAHYGVSNKIVYQWVRDQDTAYHAGNFNINLESIGIEHDATTTQNASEDTYNTSIELVAELCKRYNIPPDDKHIIGHREATPTQCPGTLDLNRIREGAKKLLTPEANCKECEEKLADITLEKDKYKKEARESRAIIADLTAKLKEADDSYKIVDEEYKKVIQHREDLQKEVSRLIAQKFTLKESLNFVLRSLVGGGKNG